MAYLAPTKTATFDGLLFDMDGTIIDSTTAIRKHWQEIGQEIGIDPEDILRTSHGRRSIDVLKILSPERATWEYVCDREGRLPKTHGEDAVEIPGARKLLDSIIARNHKWAIVTSGTVPLVSGWLDVLGLPHPEHLVTAECVENGKPDPTCYAMGREKLGLSRSDARVVVFEDSPAGIKSGKAAGCQVIALVTSHTVEEVMKDADWVVRDLSSVKVVGGPEGKVTLEISDAFVRK